MKTLEQQLNQAYQEHSDVIYRLCLYKTSNVKQSEDLVQDTFIRFWDCLAKGQRIENVKSFLYQITRNLIIDYYRKKKSESLDTLQEFGFDPQIADHESIIDKADKNIALEFINKLDEKYRDIIYMRLVEDMSLVEIAKILKISTNNATVRFHRGLKQLESYLNK